MLNTQVMINKKYINYIICLLLLPLNFLCSAYTIDSRNLGTQIKSYKQKRFYNDKKLNSNQPIDSNYIQIGDYQLSIKNIPKGKKYRIDNSLNGNSKFIQSNEQMKFLKEKGHNYSPIEQYVIISEDKEKIALISVLGSTDDAYTTTNFELFDNAGKLIYTIHKRNYIPASCAFFKKSNRTIVNWGGFEENMGFKLYIYDQFGTKKDSIFNVGRYISSEESQYIFYTKDFDYSHNHKDKNTLYYYNIETGNSWEKEINNTNSIRIIEKASDGKSIICQADKEIFLINISGEIIWKLLRNEEHIGSFFLSNNGKYILRISGAEDKIFLYNIVDNDLLWEKKLPSNNKYYCGRAAFLGENLFAISSMTDKRNIRFDFFSIEGHHIYSYESNFNSCRPFSLIKEKDNKISIEYNNIDTQTIDSQILMDYLHSNK
jgi:calcineurin-like phosphoesterase family protein